MAEDHTESVQEEMHEHAHHAKEKWIGWAALTAAMLAALAAIAGAQASTHLTNSSRQQMGANDTWAFFQAKSIKSSILKSKMDTLTTLGKEAAKADEKKVAEYEGEMEKLKETGDEHEKLSSEHLETSETFELAVTLFHVSIAIAAVGVLTKLPAFWYVSMLSGAVGIYFMVTAYMHAPGNPAAKPAEHAPPPTTATMHAPAEHTPAKEGG